MVSGQSQISLRVLIQARVIVEQTWSLSSMKSIGSHLLVENKPKKELIRMLQQMGYDSDPVKAWKQAQEKAGLPFYCNKRR